MRAYILREDEPFVSMVKFRPFKIAAQMVFVCPFMAVTIYVIVLLKRTAVIGSVSKRFF